MRLNNRFDRRRFMGTAAVFALLPFKALALTVKQSEDLVKKVIADVQRIINSGKPLNAMLVDFQAIFRDYGDVPTIARYCLGAPWRTASAAQQRAYIAAFEGYISRKYGRQFKKFEGGKIKIVRTRDAGKLGMLVETTVTVPGTSPYSVEWNVNDRSGKPKFINLIVEGVSMLATERTEMGAMLESFQGNMDKFIAHLKTA